MKSKISVNQRNSTSIGKHPMNNIQIFGLVMLILSVVTFIIGIYILTKQLKTEM